MDWASLHHHTTYSFGDGFGTPEQHLARAAELGISSLAFTEHGNVSSHFRAEKAAAGTGVKPIFGVEAYTGPVSRDKRQQMKWHLTVLAADQQGYRNLNEIVTQSYRDFHYHPTVSGESLAANHAGLVVLSGCSGSLLASVLLGGKGIPEPSRPDLRGAEGVLRRFADLLGSNYYIECQPFPELPRICAMNEAYETLSRRTGIPLVATGDIHYPQPGDNEMQLILHAVHRGKASIDDAAREWNYDVRLTLPESDTAIYQSLQRTGLSAAAARLAIENSAIISEQCHVILPKAERLRYPGTDDAAGLLMQWLRDGWRYREIGRRPQAEQDWYHERIIHETKLFLDKDIFDYLLCTSEAVRWAKDSGIPVGPGRGSSAASVVVWLLRITEVDPIRHPGLLFERFLDPTRLDMPDIDIDVDDTQRHLIKEHLADKYGAECVGSIANFVRYKARNSIADVARVHQMPAAAIEPAKARMIERSSGDSRFDATIEDTVDMFPDVRAVFSKFPDLWKAARLEGNVRGMSVHAAGMAIANSPLTDICAVYERDGIRALSIDKLDAEYAGMLKQDWLGLTTMGMIGICLNLTGYSLEDLYAIPDDNPKTLEIFARNDVAGIFQFEGRATRLVNRDICPVNFSEIVDINALSRPGPLFSGATAEYGDVKHGRRVPERFHPLVSSITGRTKGQIIYQEQILQIVREIGGFDWAQTSEIRHIISKRKGQQSFQENMERFQEGAERLHGMHRDVSEKVWQRIVTSGTYAFVIAHSVGYATLAWYTAYFKAHYPEEFYAASLAKAGTGAHADQAVFRLLKDAARHGVAISPPLLNWSKSQWTIHPDSRILVAGWQAVPGLAAKTADKLVSDREANGAFTSWGNLERVPGIGPVKAKQIEAFALADDPFQLKWAGRILGRVRSAIDKGEITAPVPTSDAAGISAIKVPRGRFRHGMSVVFMGIVRERIYRQYAENMQSRTGDDMEDILAHMKMPDLQDYCTLYCFDTTDDEVCARFSRFVFPRFKARIDSINIGHDVVIMEGRASPGYFGTPISVEQLYVIDPED